MSHEEFHPPGTNGSRDLILQAARLENRDEAPLDIHLNYCHCVIAEDIHDLDGYLPGALRAFMENAFKLYRPVAFCTERLPFVLENVIAGPDIFVCGERLLVGLHSRQRI